VKKLIFNKKIIIVFLLLSVFAVGTQTFIEPVEAAKWKKYDSGKFTHECPPAGYKKTMTYQSYTKGSNDLFVNLYTYSKKTNKKKLNMKIIFSKENGTIKIKTRDYSWNYTNKEEFQAPVTVKNVYKTGLKTMIKEWSTPLKNKAYKIESFKVKKNTFKVYRIENGKDSFSGMIYKNNDEYITTITYKDGDKIVFDRFNSKRVLSSRKTFDDNLITGINSTSVTSFTKEMDKIIAKLKSA